MDRAIIKIKGIVQGVGFRPFINRLAREYGIKGYIVNTSSGVELEAEADRRRLDEFISAISSEAPIFSHIEAIDVNYSKDLKNYTGFEIKRSKTEQTRSTLISPDIAICPDCLRELNNPGDRRYRYPFINCTNCGPRFTIIKDVPYDREKTSMASFEMCPECKREYTDISNRRYHAQPNCCNRCGPKVLYYSEDSELSGEDAIESARRCLKNGGIVAVKGIGGIHLACLPNEKAAGELRRRKHRDEKPFALMCRDAESAAEMCEMSMEEKQLLESFRRPIVLLKKKDTAAYRYISENNYIGIMFPYTPLHYLLLGDDINALIMTSANISDTPIICENEDALERLREIADGFLLNNRDIVTPCDDSLYRIFNGGEYPLRRSRGYVPYPIAVRTGEKSILACGAEQKASFCLSKGSYAFLSQHIGDLKNLETFEHYSKQIAHFEHMFDIIPRAIACDLHPDYMSSEYARRRAEETGISLFTIQHHHAHMASCMADNGLDEPVIGLIWDGTGLGTDGKIWGAECLLGDRGSFERKGSILPIAIPGGDRAITELDRTAYSLLNASGCSTKEIKSSESYAKMMALGINTPYSSGMGRLFDGVAAILNIKSIASYEGQGAVLLEAAAEEINGLTPYPIVLENNVFDWRPMIKEIYADKLNGIKTGRIAARFMDTLVCMAQQQCVNVRAESGINKIVLSGGSFQNMYMLKRITAGLTEKGFEVYTHSRASTNDEGICLGQLAIAAKLLEKR